MCFMALIITLVLCARSQDSVMSVSVRRVRVVFSTAEIKGGGKSCRKTRETAASGRLHPESLAHLAGFEYKPLVYYVRAFTH